MSATALKAIACVAVASFPRLRRVEWRAFAKPFWSQQLGQFAGLIASGLLLCLFVLSVSVALVPWFGQLPARPHYLLLGLHTGGC